MNVDRRFSDLEKILTLRYETLGEVERDLVMTTDPFAKAAIKQRLREEVLPGIRQYENEYWRLLAQVADNYSPSVDKIEDAIIQINQEVNRIEVEQAGNYPDELMHLLLEIRDKLNTPNLPAAAKMKLALPLIPGILGYEVELDTEATIRRIFQPVRRLFGNTSKK